MEITIVAHRPTRPMRHQTGTRKATPAGRSVYHRPIPPELQPRRFKTARRRILATSGWNMS
jgi:hypothetical protein